MRNGSRDGEALTKKMIISHRQLHEFVRKHWQAFEFQSLYDLRGEIFRLILRGIFGIGRHNDCFGLIAALSLDNTGINLN
jgi:hypothetical protein